MARESNKSTTTLTQRTCQSVKCCASGRLPELDGGLWDFVVSRVGVLVFVVRTGEVVMAVMRFALLGGGWT